MEEYYKIIQASTTTELRQLLQKTGLNYTGSRTQIINTCKELVRLVESFLKEKNTNNTKAEKIDDEYEIIQASTTAELRQLLQEAGLNCTGSRTQIINRCKALLRHTENFRKEKNAATTSNNNQSKQEQESLYDKDSKKLIHINLKSDYKIEVEFNVRYERFYIEGIIDSGSPISIIKESACDGMVITKYEESSFKFTGLNNSVIKFLGVTHQNIQVNGAKLSLELFVVDEDTMTSPLLLGRDFLTNKDVEILIKDNKVYAGKAGSFPLYFDYSEPRESK